MHKANILIVEDKFIVAEDLSVTLQRLGYSVCGVVASGEEVLTKARECLPDVVLMDIRLQGIIDGIDAAQELMNKLKLPVIYMTAYSDQTTLRRASATDPDGYIMKPYDERQLYTTIELALNKRKKQYDADSYTRSEKNDVDRQGVKAQRAEFSRIIGEHPKMKDLLNSIELVAITDVGVHIFGENGTGKELVADAIHRISARRQKPFIKLNCSAIPTTLLESTLFGYAKGAFTGAQKDQEGFIERAEGGTLFLDEIGDLSPEMQIKLLRVLQSHEYNRVGESLSRTANIRVITATNQNLHTLVEKGKIREDFYYRINVFPLVIPPLRERGQDVLLIAEQLRTDYSDLFSKKIYVISDEVKRIFVHYQWPGNVRELENVLKRAFVLVQGASIGVEHLPSEMLEAGSENGERRTIHQKITKEFEDDCERRKIIAALDQTGGSKGQAAYLLGYSRITLWKKLKRYGISPRTGKSATHAS